MRRIDFAPRAIDDLLEIASYGEQQYGRRKARAYAFAIQAVCESLASGELKGRPQSGGPPGILKYRSASHFVFYCLSDTQLIVIRVLHVSMNHEDHL